MNDQELQAIRERVDKVGGGKEPTKRQLAKDVLALLAEREQLCDLNMTKKTELLDAFGSHVEESGF